MERNQFIPFEDEPTQWDDMGSYYEGDLAPVIELWPQPPQWPPESDPLAPNGWTGDAA